MTQRERSTPSEGSLAAVRSPADLAVPLGSLLLTTSGPSSLWEQWYENASVPQRQQALARAGEQGILFAHQLPTPEGAPAKRAGDSLTHIPGTPSRRPLLTALLHGPAPELEPVRPSPIQPI